MKYDKVLDLLTERRDYFREMVFKFTQLEQSRRVKQNLKAFRASEEQFSAAIALLQVEGEGEP